MPIDTLCPNCGRLIYAPEEMAGKDVLCPGCLGVVRVVATAEIASSSQEPVMLACPGCNAPVRVVPRLIGLRVRCNSCQSVLLVSLSLTKSDLAGLTSGQPVARPIEASAKAVESDASRQGSPPPLPSGAAPLPQGGPSEQGLGSQAGDRESLAAIRPRPARKHRQTPQVPPWFWPSVVALAATAVMLLGLAMIKFAR